MKISSSKLFPYPVLWFVNDDYTESEFEVDIDTNY